MNTVISQSEQATEAKQRLAVAAGAALLAAGVILVMFVLPAELPSIRSARESARDFWTLA
jgi:hypothetical protein